MSITLSPEERSRRYAARCDLAADEVAALLEMMRDARADTRERAAAELDGRARRLWERGTDEFDPVVVGALIDAVRALPVEGF